MKQQFLTKSGAALPVRRFVKAFNPTSADTVYNIQKGYLKYDVVTVANGGTKIIKVTSANADLLAYVCPGESVEFMALFNSPGTGSHWVTLNRVVKDEAIVDTGNGFGSSHTFIRRFVNSTISGKAITFSQSSTNGDFFTVHATGQYAISYSDIFSNSVFFGLQRNGDPTDTFSVATPPANRLAITVNSANNSMSTSWVGWLDDGDIIYPKSQGATAGADEDLARITITKLQ